MEDYKPSLRDCGPSKEEENSLKEFQKELDRVNKDLESRHVALPRSITEPDPEFLKSEAIKLAEFLIEKNKAYGNSFHSSGEVLKILYPDGVRPEQYPDLLFIVRIWDKLKRIATDKDAFGESPYKDIMGYSLLAYEKHTNK
jgi:hypothetical protein